jgi:hypothetical protein
LVGGIQIFCGWRVSRAWKRKLIRQLPDRAKTQATVAPPHLKELQRWTSLPDSAKPYLSEPPVWERPKIQTLAQKMEKHLPQTLKATVTPKQIALPGGGSLITTNPRNMRRTLLAVGFAVLVSMMLAPHGDKHGVSGFGPFFYDWSWFGASYYWYPGWFGTRVCHIGRVMIDVLILQTIFLAVLAAVLVNIRSRRRSGK